jgi:hypothetical protein
MILGLIFVAFTGPALADGKDEAREICAAALKSKYGIPTDVTSRFQISGSGSRFSMSGKANYAGATNARVGCKTNNGRVTAIGNI